MSIAIACVKCQQPLRVGDEQAGQVLSCPQCGQAMRVPTPPKPLTSELIQPSPRRNHDAEAPRPSDHLDEGIRDLRQREAQTSHVLPLPDRRPPEVDDLGRPFASFNRSFDYRIAAAVVVGLAAFVALVLLLPQRRHLTPAGLTLFLVPINLFALAVVLFFVLKKRIFIYWLCPGGIVWQKDDGVHFGVWEDVCLFQPKVNKVIEEKETFFDDQHKSFDVHTCEIGFKNGQLFDFDTAEVVDFLHRQVLKELAPVYLERLERGETISLWPFQFDNVRLRHANDEVPWSAIDMVYVIRNKVRVIQRGGEPWVDVPLAEVAMASLFVMLADRLVRQHNPRPDANDNNLFDFG